jgi:hypothetical protein
MRQMEKVGYVGSSSAATETRPEAERRLERGLEADDAGARGGWRNTLMKARVETIGQTVAAFTLVVLLAAGGSVMAVEQCPVDDAAVEHAGGYGRAVEALVRSAPNCERAYQVLEVCQMGSSGDNALAAIVQSKCDPLFKDKAGASAKKAYRKAQDRRNKIAEKNEGTMYQGLAAVCQAKASRDFARKYSR